MTDSDAYVFFQFLHVYVGQLPWKRGKLLLPTPYLPSIYRFLPCLPTVFHLHWSYSVKWENGSELWVYEKWVKGKGLPRQAKVAQGIPGRLRSRIFSTFSTTRVVGRQPYAPVTFTPGEIPGTHFQSLSRLQGTWFCRKEPQKKSQVTTPGIDPGTVRLVAQRLIWKVSVEVNGCVLLLALSGYF